MDNWSPSQAAATLHDLPALRQEAHGRVVGLTWMLWGIAFAASISMEVPDMAAFHWGWHALLAALTAFLPLAGAAITTGALWAGQAIYPDTRLRPAWSLAILAILAPLVGLLVFLIFIPLSFLLLMVAGAFLPGDDATFSSGPSLSFLGIAVWAAAFGLSAWSGPSMRWLGWLVAGALVVTGLAVAIIVQLAGLSHVAILEAAPVLVIFIAAGLSAYRRG